MRGYDEEEKHYRWIESLNKDTEEQRRHLICKAPDGLGVRGGDSCLGGPDPPD